MAATRANATARPQESEVSNARTDLPEPPAGFITVSQWKKMPRQEVLYCFSDAMQKMGLGEFWRHPQRWEAEEVQEILQEIVQEGRVAPQTKARSQDKARWRRPSRTDFVTMYAMSHEGDLLRTPTKKEGEILTGHFGGQYHEKSGYLIQAAKKPLWRIVCQLLSPIIRPKYPDRVTGTLALAVIDSAEGVRKINWASMFAEMYVSGCRTLREKRTGPCNIVPIILAVG